jgi:hypothetical protein
LRTDAGGARQVITTILALALLLTAGLLIARNRISVLYAERLSNLDEHSTTILTVAMGAVLGILVTFSSVGAGAIGVTALLLLYPRISTARIVGSDIAHAVPLTLIAGLGHGAMGSVDVHALVSLLAGSFPGIFPRQLDFPPRSRSRSALHACRSPRHRRSANGARCRHSAEAGYFRGRNVTLSMMQAYSSPRRSGRSVDGRQGIVTSRHVEGYSAAWSDGLRYWNHSFRLPLPSK